MNYEATANSLVDRIAALAKANPDVLTVDNPFDLFKMGLDITGLEPSYAQAQYALAFVKAQAKKP